MSANVAAAAPAPATDSAKKEARGRRFAKGPKKEGQGEPGKPRRAQPRGTFGRRTRLGRGDRARRPGPELAKEIAGMGRPAAPAAPPRHRRGSRARRSTARRTAAAAAATRGRTPRPRAGAHPGGKTRSNKEAATLKFLARRIEQKAERELTEAQKKQIEELGGEAVILEKEVARKARAAERKEKEEAAAKANP